MCSRIVAICCLLIFIAFASIIAVYIFISKESDVSGDVTYLTERDFVAAESAKFEPGGYVAAEYNSHLFEGDIVQEKGLKGTQSEGVTRDKIWPGAIVPYELERRHFSKNEVLMIASAFQDITRQTCVKFRGRTAEDRNRYIRITTGSGCSSYVGRINHENGQPVELGEGCLNPGTIRHELMHALGFDHEQSRTDRDSYVRIIYENIWPGAESQFEKSNYWEVTKLGTTYDFGSVMHYSSNAFAIDENKPTIVRRDGRKFTAQRKSFSETDVYEINKLYNCPSVRTPTTTSTRAPTTTYRFTNARTTWQPRTTRRRNSQLRGRETYYLGHEYIYVQQLKTWADAEEDCVAWGGHLVSFHSFMEASVVAGLHNYIDRVWIGHKYNRHANTFQWSDGSSRNYIRSEEVSKTRVQVTDQSCSIQDGHRLMINVFCSEHYAFVCKR